MRIQPLIPGSDADPRALDPTYQLDRLLADWQTSGRAFRVLARGPAMVDGRAGQRCEIAIESPGAPAIVNGWTVVPYGARSLLVFATQALAADVPRLRPMFGAVLASVRFKAPESIAATRGTHLDTGRAFLAAVTPEDLRAIAGREAWFRHYRPGTGSQGPVELGYYTVRFEEGPLGAIDPRRDPARYDPDEQTPGLVVTVRGHYFDGSTSGTYDSEAVYWLAWDRTEEAWSIRGTRRWGPKKLSEAQTGIRTPRSAGDPGGTITVIDSRNDGATRDQQSWRVPDVYLSQATRWALPFLLARQRGPGRSAPTASTRCRRRSRSASAPTAGSPSTRRGAAGR